MFIEWGYCVGYGWGLWGTILYILKYNLMKIKHDEKYLKLNISKRNIFDQRKIVQQ